MPGQPHRIALAVVVVDVHEGDEALTDLKDSRPGLTISGVKLRSTPGILDTQADEVRHGDSKTLGKDWPQSDA